MNAAEFTESEEIREGDQLPRKRPFVEVLETVQTVRQVLANVLQPPPHGYSVITEIGRRLGAAASEKGRLLGVDGVFFSD